MKLKWLILATCLAVLWTKFLSTAGSIIYRNHVESAAPEALAAPMPTPPALKTWRDRIEEIARSGGSRDLLQGRSDRQLFYPKDYDLPEEYYNGAAYRIQGTEDTYIIYSKYPCLLAPPLLREPGSTQYEIAPDVAEAAVSYGHAIILLQSLSAETLSNLAPSGSDRFVLIDADESANPKVCYLEQGVCLESTTLSIEEMKQILRSGKPILAQP